MRLSSFICPNLAWPSSCSTHMSPLLAWALILYCTALIFTSSDAVTCNATIPNASAQCRTEQACDSFCAPDGQCILGSLNCITSHQICNRDLGNCVECLTSQNCTTSGIAPFCEPAAHKCVQCYGPEASETNPCGSNDFCGATCIDNSCLNGINCTAIGQICNPDFGTCHHCKHDVECTALDLNVCLLNGTCAECRVSSDCRNPDRRVCFEHTCVACYPNSTADCRSDATCDSVCQFDGTCSLSKLNCSTKELHCSVVSSVPKCVFCDANAECQTDSRCDATCAPNGLSCDPGTNLNCLTTFQRCDKNSSRCTCDSDSSCAEAFPERPHCEAHPVTGAKRCVACVSNAECRSDTDCASTCSVLLGECIASTSNNSSNNCVQRDDDRNMCDTDSGICVECLVSDPETCPRCHNGTCLACLRDRDCRNAGECNSRCDTSLGTCVVGDLNCTKVAMIDPKHFMPVCHVKHGICAECTAENDLLCVDPTPVCLVEYSLCVECLDVSDCNYVGRCSAACVNHTCIYDSEARKNGTGVSMWDRCESPKHCVSSSLKCVECYEDSQCAIPGSHRLNVHACDLSTNQCVLASWFLGFVIGTCVVVFIGGVVGAIIFIRKRIIKSRLARAFDANLSSYYEPIDMGKF